MPRGARILSVLLLVLTLAGCATTVAKPAPQPGLHGRLVLDMVGEVRKALHDEASASEREARLTAIMNARIDVASLGTATLRRTSPHCEGMNRTEFDKLLTRQLVQQFLVFVNAKKENRAALDLRYQGEGETKQGVFVRTLAPYPGQDLELKFWLHPSGGRWLIFDVAIDDLSMAENYAAQFSRLARLGGGCGVMRALQQK